MVKLKADGWTKKFKGDRYSGGAWIYTHPDAIDDRAIVENHLGFRFNGKWFPSLDAAKRAAIHVRPIVATQQGGAS